MVENPPVEGTYSDRHGRKPPITTSALVELVLRKLLALERDGLLTQAFRQHVDREGAECGPLIAEPEEWVITELARPGLWRWLGRLEEVVATGDFPDWDEDTLFDVVELFHNQVVSAPRPLGDGSFAEFDRDHGKRLYREAVNQVLVLRQPPFSLRADGRVVEVGERRASPADGGYDVYLSHASEERDEIARPLAEELRGRGYSVFFDDFTLVAGDALNAKIGEGLARARRGVVVISPAFLKKAWPRRELDALLKRETETGESILIPIWHRVDHQEVAGFSALLADRLALTSSAGIEALAVGIERALQRRGADQVAPVPGAGAGTEPMEDRASASSGPARGHRLRNWLRGDGKSRGSMIAVAVIAGVILLGLAALAKQVTSGGSDRPIQSQPESTPESGPTGTSTAGGTEADKKSPHRVVSPSEKKLMTFVRGRNAGLEVRCGPAATSPEFASASVRCRINGRPTIFSRFPGRSATKSYFEARRSTLPQYEGEFKECEGSAESWTWEGSPGGQFALRGNRDEARILWTYASHHVIAIASGGPGSASRLCQLWEKLGTLL